MWRVCSIQAEIAVAVEEQRKDPEVRRSAEISADNVTQAQGDRKAQEIITNTQEMEYDMHCWPGKYELGPNDVSAVAAVTAWHNEAVLLELPGE
ncbi:hypothetical protein QQ045_016559 [Rhodiola kirilowii]